MEQPLMEKSLIILKPDAVKRGLAGRIISRMEDAGLKIIGAKMIHVDEKFGRRHYADLAERRGEKVAKMMIQFLASAPVLALCVEGVEAVENVRKLVGTTEPKSALPGTIRGDFSHASFAHANRENKAVENLIHASGSVEEAKTEVELWFGKGELYDYKLSYEEHVF